MYRSADVAASPQPIAKRSRTTSLFIRKLACGPSNSNPGRRFVERRDNPSLSQPESRHEFLLQHEATFVWRINANLKSIRVDGLCRESEKP